jgi:DNA modification methylase
LDNIKKIEDNSIDIIITDPPYWLGSKFKIDAQGQYVGTTTDCKHTGTTWKIGDGYWLEAIFKEFFRVIKHGSFVLLFSIDRFIDLPTYNARRNGFDVCQSVYWKFKQGMPKGTNTSKRVDALILQGNAGTRSLRKQEFDNPSGKEIEVKSGSNGFSHDVKLINRKSETVPLTDAGKKYAGSVYGLACLAPEIEVIGVYRKPAKYDNMATDAAKSLEDPTVRAAAVYVDRYKEKYGKFPGQVLEVNKPNSTERNGHPTQKPVQLMEDLIMLFSNDDDIVLDPFCGSGTTLVAAKKMDRKYLGFEINETFKNIADERLK